MRLDENNSGVIIEKLRPFWELIWSGAIILLIAIIALLVWGLQIAWLAVPLTAIPLILLFSTKTIRYQTVRFVHDGYRVCINPVRGNHGHEGRHWTDEYGLQDLHASVVIACFELSIRIMRVDSSCF